MIYPKASQVPIHGNKNHRKKKLRVRDPAPCWQPTLCRNCPPWLLHGASTGSSASLPGGPSDRSDRGSHEDITRYMRIMTIGSTSFITHMLHVWNV